jgi:hypothetical protein
MPDRLTLDSLAADPVQAMSLSSAEAAVLLAQAGAVEAVLRARLAAANGSTAPESSPPEKPNVMLTMAEVAARLRKSVRWVRDHWRKEMPFALRRGRTVLFPEAEFERWLKRP